nr:ROK family protein [Streptomyces canus]
MREHGPLTRAELGILSGLSRTTLYDAVAALMDSGTVLASVPTAAQRKRGRPAEVLALNTPASQLLGIEFAQGAVRIASVDAAHEIIDTAAEPHAQYASWQARIDLAWRLADSLTGGALRPGAFCGIGLGVVEPIVSAKGYQLSEPWRNTVLALVRQRFGALAQIDNDTRLAVLAETIWGAAAGAQNVLYLRLSHGVSGGLVMAGTLHRGAHGRSGMFGHITVEPNGASCGCGGRGCLETVASVGAVLDAYRATGGKAEDVLDLVAALESDDRAAHAILARVGGFVGRMLTDVSHAVGPEVIVLGGELVDAGPALMAPIEHMFSTQATPGSYGVPRIVPAGLGDFGTALGAIAMLNGKRPSESY